MKVAVSILKIMFWLLLSLVLIMGVVSLVIYQFKDKIIATIVTELNKDLNTKVEVEKIDLEFWRTFPNVSLSFYHIKMKGSFLGDSSNLLTADKVSLNFNALDLYHGQYKVSSTLIEDANLHLIIREDGQNNFTIIDKDEDAPQKESTVEFNLEKIDLRKVSVVFENRINHQIYDVFCNNAGADFNTKMGSWGVKIGGDFFVHQIMIAGQPYLASKELKLETSLLFDKESGYYRVAPSSVIIGNSHFTLDGKFGVSSGKDIYLGIKGEKTSIQTIIALLPKDISQKLGKYKSEGNVYFSGSLKGKVDSHYAPEAAFEFGCSEVSFFHPELSKKIRNISFKGQYSNGKKSRGELSYLRLKDMKGAIEGRTFSSDLEIKDFTNPYIKFSFNGSFDLGSLRDVFKSENLESLNGVLKTDIFFEGAKRDLEHRKTLEKITSYGNLEIDNCNFSTKGGVLKVRNLNTKFSFDHESIFLHELTAKVQDQDVSLKGKVSHYLMYLAGTSNALDGELQLSAARLDIEKFVFSPEKKDDAGDDNKAGKSILPEEGKFVLECDVKKIVFKKFSSSDVKGNLMLNQNILTAGNVSMKSGGGQFRFDGKLDFSRANSSMVSGKAKCTNVNVDSVMAMFDNFGQTFLTKDQLKGQLSVDADFQIPLDNNNKISEKGLKTLLKVSLKNGELNNFEPMNKLARFIDAKELSNIRFSEISNTIRIEDEVIYIPDMEIKSNLNTVGIIGTQTFDGKMNFKLRVALKNFKKKDPDAVYGAIKEEGANTTLYLTLKGSPGKIVVAYDKDAVKGKVKEGWQKEKQEFKDMFKSGSPRREKRKAVEINEEEEISID